MKNPAIQFFTFWLVIFSLLLSSINLPGSGQLLLLGTGSSPKTAAFDPSTVAGLKVWLKANALTYNEGDPISSWTDSSGNGNNFTGTAPTRPEFRTNVINGLPVVRFTSHGELLSSSFNLDDSKKTTIFFVAKSINDQWNEVIGTSGDSFYLAFHYPTTTLFRIWTNTSSNNFDTTIDDATAAFKYYTVTINETTGANGVTNIRQQGVDKGDTSSRSRGDFGSLYLGDARPANQGLHGDLAEILIYEAAITGTDLTNIETYLKNKYGL
ncbi:MAG: hypothetical protein A3F80_01020 [Candidatus Melainabacteria bacterium RIFCSPLOWO2_12_FULL_35_11]|nr:MAG: hypothetical protein A3F80_01020 [Candidatus Melainabacteria bacterium RIFCSPLOWO2_12_FULL_35_11]